MNTTNPTDRPNRQLYDWIFFHIPTARVPDVKIYLPERATVVKIVEIDRCALDRVSSPSSPSELDAYSQSHAQTDYIIFFEAQALIEINHWSVSSTNLQVYFKTTYSH